MTTTAAEHPAMIGISDDRLRRLRVFNVVMGLLHTVQGVAMIVLGDTRFELPVGTMNPGGPPGTPLSEFRMEDVGGIPLAWGTGSFLLISALFHFLIASPVGFPRYADELRRGRNRFRWVEYAFSATLMIVLIAQITGVVDLAALIAIAVVNVSMILFGWIMEVANPPDRPAWWTPFWFGCIAGAGPWVAIATYLAVNVSQPGAEGPPTFVYGILVSIFVLFNCFAVNQWLQYRRIGRWDDYVFGESVYVVLSLTAKSALAWQVFANTLV